MIKSIKIPSVRLFKPYYISDSGCVYDDKYGKCEIEKYVSTNGYNYIRLMLANGKYHMFNIDIIVGYVFVSSERKKLGMTTSCEVHHIDGDTYNDHASNITWVERIELWEPVSDPDVVEDTYMVSSFGRIKNVKTGKIVSGCQSKGYQYITMMTKDDKRVQRAINRLVATSFVKGVSIWRTIVNHINGNGTDNYWKNLEWVTFSENTKHSYMLGLSHVFKGDDSSSSKINSDIAQKIWMLLIDDPDALNGREPTHGRPKIVWRYIKDIYPEVTRVIIQTIRRKKSWGGKALKPLHEFEELFINADIAQKIWMLLIDDPDALNGREPTHGHCGKVCKYIKEDGYDVPEHKIRAIKFGYSWKSSTEHLPRGNFKDDRFRINADIAQKIWMLLIDDPDALNGREPTCGSIVKVFRYMRDDGFDIVTEDTVEYIKNGRAWCSITGINKEDHNGK